MVSVILQNIYLIVKKYIGATLGQIGTFFFFFGAYFLMDVCQWIYSWGKWYYIMETYDLSLPFTWNFYYCVFCICHLDINYFGFCSTHLNQFLTIIPQLKIHGEEWGSVYLYTNFKAGISKYVSVLWRLEKYSSTFSTSHPR